MKKLVIIAVVYFIMPKVFAQENGVQFQQAANWQEVLAKAKQENKHIFIDFYATWCGPCKEMDKKIFPDQSVGTFINDKFIAVKIQMDKTSKDDAYVQGWYNDAQKLEKDYSITAYPTYMFFSPAGQPLHRFSGGSRTGADFITKSKNALDPSKQYYTNVVQYKDHLGDSAFLYNAIMVAMSNSDRKMAAEIGDHFIDIVDPLNKRNLIVFREIITSGSDKAYKIIMANAKQVDSIMEGTYSSGIATVVMYNDDLKEYFETGKEVTNWDKLIKGLKKKYPMVDPMIIDKYTAGYYRVKKDTAGFEKALLTFTKKYENRFNDGTYNDQAWEVFLVSKDKQMLQKALKWAEKSLEMVPKTPGSNYPNYMDTYANLLYRLGQREEAIKWQTRAVELMPKDHKVLKSMEKTLDKMKKGEKV